VTPGRAVCMCVSVRVVHINGSQKIGCSRLAQRTRGKAKLLRYKPKLWSIGSRS